MAVVALLSIVAAACGSDSKTTSEGGDQAGAQVDPNGILRVGHSLSTVPGGLHLDPTKSQTLFDAQFMQLVLGTLVRVSSKGTVEPYLAKSFTLVDPQTVKFTLRDGVKYTDGSVYDAQAVKDGLLRTRDQVTPSAKSAQDSSIQQIGEITVDGPLALTVKLKTPVGGQFVAAMATAAGAIPSPAQLKAAPDAIDAKAIGAGPYTVVEFSPAGIKLKKNPSYVDAAKWQVAELHWVDIADQAALLNGLRAGSLEMAQRLTPENGKTLTADPAFAAATAFPEGGYLNTLMCMGKPPFDNEKVRQAINIGIDREELNKLVYEGLGAPAYGLWPKGHVNHEPKVESMLKYDPVKAKKLIAESGVPSPSFDMYYSTPEMVRVLEALQAQLKKIGVDMKITAGDVLTKFVEPKAPGARTAPGSRTGYGKYVMPFDPTSRSALCGVSHPEILEKLAPAAAAAPGDPTVAKLYREADLTIAEHAYYLTLLFEPRIVGYAKARVGGTLEQDAHGVPQFDNVFVKKK